MYYLRQTVCISILNPFSHAIAAHGEGEREREKSAQAKASKTGGMQKVVWLMGWNGGYVIRYGQENKGEPSLRGRKKKNSKRMRNGENG